MLSLFWSNVFRIVSARIGLLVLKLGNELGSSNWAPCFGLGWLNKGVLPLIPLFKNIMASVNTDVAEGWCCNCYQWLSLLTQN